jgi:hypothetical protein
VVEDRFDLSTGYPGEPFEEVITAGAVFEVGEEGLHGDAGAAENPGAADGLGVTPERFAKTAASESLSGV